MNKSLLALTLLACVASSSAQSIFAGNIIKNAGFDDGAFSPNGASVAVPDWTGTTSIGLYGTQNFQQMPFGAYSSGTQFAGGGNLASNSLTQVFTIDSGDFATIDAGLANFTVSGWFGGWVNHDDQAEFQVRFLDSSASVLDTVVIGGVDTADRGGVTTMLFRDANGVIAAGTRTIDMTLLFTRFSGAYSDGAADTLSFSADAVPEPASMLALATCIGLALKKRKRA